MFMLNELSTVERMHMVLCQFDDREWVSSLTIVHVHVE